MRHLNKMHDGQHDCPNAGCNQSFPNGRLAAQHWKINHDPTRERFACEFCNKLFNTKYTYLLVFKLKYIQIPTSSPFRMNLSFHRKIHTRSIDDILGCAHCDKTFHRKIHLKSHLFLVHVREPTPCPKCNKICSNPFTMRNHLLRHREHNQECKVCHRRFYRSSDLKEHFRVRHTNERPFVCAKCGVRLRNSTALNKHIAQSCKIQQERCLKTRTTFPRVASMLQCR